MPCRRGSGFEISPPAALHSTLPRLPGEPRSAEGFRFLRFFSPASPNGWRNQRGNLSPIHVVTSRGASALFPLLLAGWSLASSWWFGLVGVRSCSCSPAFLFKGFRLGF